MVVGYFATLSVFKTTQLPDNTTQKYSNNITKATFQINYNMPIPNLEGQILHYVTVLPKAY
jgi:hypothetical protein